MSTHWTVLGLLSLCSLGFTQECNQQFQENIDFPGNDITSVYSPDAEHCQLLCTQHPSCLFFTFVRPDWSGDSRHFFCYLKETSSGQPSAVTSLMGVTSGYSLKSCTLGRQPCLSKVYQDIDFYGADYTSLFTADYEECQRVCTHDPGCQFFTFVNENYTLEKIRYKCHLKFSWNVPVTSKVERKPGVVSGFSHNFQSGDSECQARIFPNTDIPGFDFAVAPSASAEHCQSMCSAHPSCTFFSFVSENLRCFLKKNEHSMVFVAKAGVTSGLPTRFCRPKNTWVKVSLEDIDFLCCHMRYETMYDPDSCQRTCTYDSQCQFYTHVNEYYFNRDYWNRCYLKRSITMPAPPKVSKLANVVSGFSKRHCDSVRSTHT